MLLCIQGGLLETAAIHYGKTVGYDRSGKQRATERQSGAANFYVYRKLIALLV